MLVAPAAFPWPPGRERHALRARAAQRRHARWAPTACSWRCRRCSSPASTAAATSTPCSSTCLLDRIEHKDLFDQAFELFWRDPDLRRPHARDAAAQGARASGAARPSSARTGGWAMRCFRTRGPTRRNREPDESMQFDAAFTVSEREVLRKADFDTMSADEWRAARRALAHAALGVRAAAHAARRASPRAGPRRLARHAADDGAPRRRAGRDALAPSAPAAGADGGAGRHLGLDEPLLAHAAALCARARPCRGARRELRLRHAAHAHHAPAAAAATPTSRCRRWCKAVEDWSGGTRITTCLHEFNQRWARRCLSSRTTVLLISDGLEHGDTKRAVARDGAPGQELPPADLAEPAAALREASSPRRPASARCCRTSTVSCRCTTSTAWSISCGCSAAPICLDVCIDLHRTMQLSNQQTLPVTQQQAWEALNDCRCCRRRSRAASRSRPPATTSTTWRSWPPSGR